MAIPSVRCRLLVQGFLDRWLSVPWSCCYPFTLTLQLVYKILLFFYSHFLEHKLIKTKSIRDAFTVWMLEKGIFSATSQDSFNMYAQSPLSWGLKTWLWCCLGRCLESGPPWCLMPCIAAAHRVVRSHASCLMPRALHCCCLEDGTPWCVMPCIAMFYSQPRTAQPTHFPCVLNFTLMFLTCGSVFTSFAEQSLSSALSHTHLSQ